MRILYSGTLDVCGVEDKNIRVKVIHYIPSLSRRLGGVATYIQLLANELGKVCDLYVVTRPSDNPLELKNCDTILIPRDKKSFIREWNKVLDDVKPNLVHINGIWQKDTWWIQKEALKRNIKTYITPHGMLDPWIIQHNHWKKVIAMFLYEKKALRSAINLIATANQERDNILKLNVTSQEVPMIPNGIDVSCIEIKSDWTIRKKILFVSRIHEKKGIELLIDTALTISDYLRDYEILIAGEGDPIYVEELKAKAEQSCLMVKFLGGVYGDAKWQLYRDADFFVLPTNSENFGYVIAEALASGIPVITTKGTPWEAIETNNCGKWIDRTKENLCNAMLEMISKKTLELESMGRRGRKLIEEVFSAKAMADALMKVYTKK